MSVEVITRLDAYGQALGTQVVGFNVTSERAAMLLREGYATRGPEMDVPPVLYLLRPLSIKGFEYQPGFVLIVGTHVTPIEAVGLMLSATPPDVVSVPGGGCG